MATMPMIPGALGAIATKDPSKHDDNDDHDAPGEDPIFSMLLTSEDEPSAPLTDAPPTNRPPRHEEAAASSSIPASPAGDSIFSVLLAGNGDDDTRPNKSPEPPLSSPDRQLLGAVLELSAVLGDMNVVPTAPEPAEDDTILEKIHPRLENDGPATTTTAVRAPAAPQPEPAEEEPAKTEPSIGNEESAIPIAVRDDPVPKPEKAEEKTNLEKTEPSREKEESATTTAIRADPVPKPKKAEEATNLEKTEPSREKEESATTTTTVLSDPAPKPKHIKGNVESESDPIREPSLVSTSATNPPKISTKDTLNNHSTIPSKSCTPLNHAQAQALPASALANPRAAKDETAPEEMPFWSPPALTQHVSYQSKAEIRKAELEALRKKKLAKPKVAKLLTAEAPTTQFADFEQHQRELLHEQRKQQKAASEILHQYRADDQLVLREATPRSRRSDHPRRSSCGSLAPDAVAAVHSYSPSPSFDHDRPPHSCPSGRSVGAATTNSPERSDGSGAMVVESCWNPNDCLAGAAFDPGSPVLQPNNDDGPSDGALDPPQERIETEPTTRSPERPRGEDIPVRSFDEVFSALETAAGEATVAPLPASPETHHTTSPEQLPTKHPSSNDNDDETPSVYVSEDGHPSTPATNSRLPAVPRSPQTPPKNDDDDENSQLPAPLESPSTISASAAATPTATGPSSPPSADPSPRLIAGSAGSPNPEPRVVSPGSTPTVASASTPESAPRQHKRPQEKDQTKGLLFWRPTNFFVGAGASFHNY